MSTTTTTQTEVEAGFAQFVNPQNSRLIPGGGAAPIALLPHVEFSDEEIDALLAGEPSCADLLRFEEELAFHEEALAAIEEFVAREEQDSVAAASWLGVQSERSGFVHGVLLREAAQATRPIEKPIREAYSFFVEAKIPSNGVNFRDRIEIFPGSLVDYVNSPEVGSGAEFAPAETIGPLHRLRFSLLIGDEIDSAEKFAKVADLATKHNSMAVCTLPRRRRNRRDQIRGDVAGHEHVLFVDAPIRSRLGRRETADELLVIDAAYALAGKAFHNAAVSAEKGIVSGTGDFNSASALSDAYALYDEEGPFLDNMGLGRMHERAEGVVYGCEITDPTSETKSNFVFVGAETARGAGPQYQFATMMALTSLQHVLQIKSPLLLVPAAERVKALGSIQYDLRLRLVGSTDKQPFTALDLSEDRESEAAQRTNAAGGVRIKAQVRIKDKPISVFTDIYPV